MKLDHAIDETPVPVASLLFGDIGSLKATDLAVLGAALLAATIAWLALGAARGPSNTLDKGRSPIASPPVVNVLPCLVAICAFGLHEADLALGTKTLAIAAVLIGVAAQRPLSDLFSGLVLRWAHSISVGDLIEVDGFCGHVCRLGIGSVCLRTPFGRLCVLRNSEFLTRTIVNHHAFPHHFLALAISLAVTEDINRIRGRMLLAIKGRAGLLDKPAPRVIFRDISGAGTTLELQAWIQDSHDSPAYRSKLQGQIAEALRDAGLDNVPRTTLSDAATDTARLEWPVY